MTNVKSWREVETKKREAKKAWEGENGGKGYC